MAYGRIAKYYNESGGYLGQIEDATNIRFNLSLNAGCRELHFTLPHYYRDSLPLQKNYWVEIYFDASTRVYSGYVEEPEGSLADWTGEINCLGFASKLRQKKLVADQQDIYGSESESHQDLDTVRKVVQYIYDNFISTESWCGGLRNISDCALAVNKFAVTDETNVFDVLHDLALIAGGYYWGIDEDRKFYFISPESLGTSLTWQVGQDVRNIRYRYTGQVVNSVQLRGGYIIKVIEGEHYNLYPLNRHFKDEGSIAMYGEQFRRLKVPTIITAQMAEYFIAGYFAKYADQMQWVNADLIGKESGFFLPWEKKVEIKDEGGSKVFEDVVSEVAVDFNAWPVLSVTVGEVHDDLIKDNAGSIYNPGSVFETWYQQQPDPESDWLPEIDDEDYDPDDPDYPYPNPVPIVLRDDTPVAWGGADSTIYGNVALTKGQIVLAQGTLLTPQPNESFKVKLYIYTRGVSISPNISMNWIFYPDAGGQSSGTITNFSKVDNQNFPHQMLEEWESIDIGFTESGVFHFYLTTILGEDLAWRYPYEGYLQIAVGARGEATQTVTAIPAHSHQGPDDGGWAGFYVGSGQ